MSFGFLNKLLVFQKAQSEDPPDQRHEAAEGGGDDQGIPDLGEHQGDSEACLPEVGTPGSVQHPSDQGNQILPRPHRL